MIRAIYHTWGITDYDDLIAAVDHVIGARLRGPAIGLAVTGYSYGGYMTNTSSRARDRFKAAASGAGHSLHRRQLRSRHLPEVVQLGARACPGKTARQVRPAFAAAAGGKVTTPTIFLGGREDWNVPVLNAELFYQSLRKPAASIRSSWSIPARHHGGWPEEFEQRLPRARAGSGSTST